MGWYSLDWGGSRSKLMENSCEHGNELSGPIKCWKIIE
jgi:hypothetical protein